MHYALVHNSRVICGPIEWNRNMFSAVLLDDLEITLQLPLTKVDTSPIIVDLLTKIVPVEYVAKPNFNPKIQGLDGPFFDYSDATKVTCSYGVRNLPIEAVKNFLNEAVARNRYQEEVKGISITIQGQDIKVTTARGDRDIYAQALLLNKAGAKWKFPNGVWLVLSLLELQTIVTAIMNHVQTVFNWEETKVAEINGKNSLTDLDLVSTDYS